MFIDWEAGSGCKQVPKSDEHCHRPEECVLTGKRKSEYGGRLCLLPNPTSKSHRD